MTVTEQRLNSNHGRFRHAARDLPPELREGRPPDSEWTAREILAHVVFWQEEALRRFDAPDRVRHLDREDLSSWNAEARERMRGAGWDSLLHRFEAAHVRLLTHVADADAPTWLGACTYRHYTEHTRQLLALRHKARDSRPDVSVRPAELVSSPR
ncbi:MAG: DinB family protein [Candidatus Dormibacteraeota bacterium]|nr:DinB family protein [Candidatus Dormibacteraeota bacterium]